MRVGGAGWVQHLQTSAKDVEQRQIARLELTDYLLGVDVVCMCMYMWHVVCMWCACGM